LYGGAVPAAPDADSPLAPFRSVVVLGFGGPEAPEEVMPFLRRVTAGRGVPDERLAIVAEHYHQFGGRSPINDQNRALGAALAAELADRGAPVAVRLANRNSPPYAADVLPELAPGPVLVLLTSPWRSYSSCRQYREDLAAAGAGVTLAKLPPYAALPGFRSAVTRCTLEALDAALAADSQGPLALVCIAHSIPTAADAAAGRPGEGGHAYSRELRDLADEVTQAAARHTGLDLATDLAWCSRSGPPQQPWLEPDILDRLTELAADGIRSVVLAPIGFLSDHMEVVYDLDTEAAAKAAELGIRLHRAPTVGTDPDFVAGLADLALARAAAARGDDAALAAYPPADCPPDCCRGRGPRPALCGPEEGSDAP